MSFWGNLRASISIFETLFYLVKWFFILFKKYLYYIDNNVYYLYFYLDKVKGCIWGNFGGTFGELFWQAFFWFVNDILQKSSFTKKMIFFLFRLFVLFNYWCFNKKNQFYLGRKICELGHLCIFYQKKVWNTFQTWFTNLVKWHRFFYW